MILKNLGLKDFQKYSKEKSIFCFGFGKHFIEFLSKFENIENIKLIIDNDKNKIGSFFTIKDKNIKIVSLTDAIKKIDNNTIFLITAAYKFGMEIYNQLENYNEIKKITVFWTYFILNCNETKLAGYKYNKIDFRKTDKIQIPKIIHYAWFGKNPMPEEYINYIEGWKKLCSDYKFCKWDENNYDISQNSYMKTAYDTKAWAFVSDYVRKDVVYKYGGVYLDTDVEMIKNIDDLLYQDGFCAFEKNLVASGLGFGAKKGHRIVKEWRDIYETLIFNEDTILKMIACPIHETEILKKYGLKQNNSLQNIMGMTVYPDEVLSGTNRVTNEPIITPNTYTIHHYGASWVDKSQKDIPNAIRSLFQKFTQSE